MHLTAMIESALPGAGNAAAMAYPLIATAKRNDVDPEA